jgi:hypothetical protein
MEAIVVVEIIDVAIVYGYVVEERTIFDVVIDTKLVEVSSVSSVSVDVKLVDESDT